MSAETAWYTASAEGRAPKCTRLVRLPYHEQIGMAAELAVARERGEAYCRHVWVAVTGERIWYWPTRPGQHGNWWMLPLRTMRMADQISQYAAGNLAVMQRIARRAVLAREWHRRNGGPMPIPKYGKKYITAAAHVHMQNSVRTRPTRMQNRVPRVVGYEPVYTGRGMWRVAALDSRDETIRLIGPWESEKDAIACARRCSQALHTYLHRRGQELVSRDGMIRRSLGKTA